MLRVRCTLIAGLFVLTAWFPAGAALLVGDRVGDSILRYDDATGAFVDVFVTSGSGGLDAPQGLAFGPDGNLYVSSQSSDQILRYDGTSGAFIDVFVDAGTGGLSFPFDIVFDGAGDLLVANSPTSEILRYDGATGAFVDVFASGGVPGLNTPRGLATDGASLFTSAEGDRIYQFDATDGSFIASFSGNDNPRAMTFGPDGNLYYTQNVSNNVARRNGVTGAVIDEFVPHDSGGLGSSLGLAFGPDGNLYVGNRGDANVLRFDGTTGAFIDAFVTNGSGGLVEPGAILFTVIPEPATGLLLAGGLLALAARRPAKC